MTRNKISTQSRQPTAGGKMLKTAPPSEELQTINVIVTGECQQGKSTLIRQLAHYCGMHDLVIGVGSGNVACTQDVGNYDMVAALQSYQLVGQDKARISGRSYADLTTLDSSEAEVVPLPYNAPKFGFRFVDTPGLNDTSGDDISIMSRILGRAAELGHVNALIYVRNVDAPFSSSFKTVFRYMQTAMPTLCNGLIVAHSNFTIDRVEEHLDENQYLDQIRQQAFQATTGLDLQHFFMDNSPDPSSPFALLQSLNEIYRLLSHLSSQKPLPVQNMKLPKTDAIRQLDAHVLDTLKRLGTGLDKEWVLAKSNAAILVSNTMAAEREIKKLKWKIEAEQAKIDELKTDEEVLLGQKSCVARYSFIGDLLFQGKFYLGKRELAYDSDYVLTSVTKSCSGGSKWLNENLQTRSWTAELSGPFFGDINGTATFYTTSKLRYSKEIKGLEATIGVLNESLATQQEQLERNQGAAGPDGTAAQLAEQITAIEVINEVIARTIFDITLWPQLRSFYHCNGIPSPEDIKNFISVYDQKISKLL